MIPLMFAAILGGGATVWLLWSTYGWIALLCAPLGGSGCAVLVGVLLAIRQRRIRRCDNDVHCSQITSSTRDRSLP